MHLVAKAISVLVERCCGLAGTEPEKVTQEQVVRRRQGRLLD
jgi:hypothetical protein